MNNEILKAVDYQNHIKRNHMDMTGEQLAFQDVGCPTCQSKLVKRNKKGTDTMFVACDKTNRPYCPFSIGMNETLAERTQRIYLKLKGKGLVFVDQQRKEIPQEDVKVIEGGQHK